MMIGIAACQPGDALPAKRTALMNELTTNMKPVCFGRYLIEVPQKSEVALGFAKSDATRIELVVPPSLSEAGFKGKLSRRESELRSLKHDVEGSCLLESIKLPEGMGSTFVYRKDSESTRLATVESLIMKNSTEWHLEFEAANESVPVIKKDAVDIASLIDARSNDTIPTSDGACLNGGLLRRIPREVEGFAGGARMEDLSWTLSFRSETSKPYAPDERVIKRTEEAIGMAGGASSGIKVLRKREVTLDGRKGEEIVALYPGDGVVSFGAKLELYGDGTYKVPTIKLNLEANRLAPPDPNDKRVFLSDEEALALWDAVVMSIRPRPGAF